jgi:hypothetical protein
MKKSRFTDSQIMDALKWAEAGYKIQGSRPVPGIRHPQCIVLTLAR